MSERVVVVVESPTKAKTLSRYMKGMNKGGLTVLASFGHVRDLIPKEGAVDIKTFDMNYEVISKNAKHVKAIVDAVKKSDKLLLATDPDREGEAIAYHLFVILQDKKALKDKTVQRVVFHEFTKPAILEAFENPRDIEMDLVNAQQARRALDYLVGFNLSPLLWRKIRPSLSAGRVQSPALSMIVARENEIQAFNPQEYWTIHADFTKDKTPFSTKLYHYDKKLDQFDIPNEERANEILATLKGAKKAEVKSVEKKQRKRSPAPPFTTSTLQQEASRKLGFGSSRTMRIAQQLYEGIELPKEGQVGLITYMRTDSVSLSELALDDTRSTIKELYGEDHLPEKPRFFKTKAKNAQEAHEAIRPTSMGYHPNKIKSSLSQEQYKLYNLIWQRTMACQMAQALVDTVSANIAVNDGLFRANGSTVRFKGFLKVYQEGYDDKKDDDDGEKQLPPLEEGEILEPEKIFGSQHFTEPPPRFSEASLVKALEEYGIGRPSTYSSIISTLQNREYTVLEKKRFIPTDVGVVVNRFLTTYFPQYVDYNFTAHLEDDLDGIARGEKEWKGVLKEFWSPFIKLVKEIDESVARKDVTQEKIDEKCPKCEAQLAVRLGKRGRFIGCTKYPDCDYTRSMDGEVTSEPEVVEGRSCPKCDSELLVRHGRFGKFIGCSGYPKCKYIEPLNQPEDTEVSCPECKKGNMVKRQSRRGKVFYSCNRYPDCKYAVWDKPLDQKCPSCDWPITTEKVTKKRGAERVCPQQDCSFSQKLDEDGDS